MIVSRVQITGRTLLLQSRAISTQKLVLWEPTYGHHGRGKPKTTYIDTLKRETAAFEVSEIAAMMADKRL